MARGTDIPARLTGLSGASTLAVVAAVLAAIPLVLSRLDGDGDLDPFFAALVVAALVIAFTAARAHGSQEARLIGRLIVGAWLMAGACAAFLLIWSQSTCGCSSPDPASLPPLPTYVGLPATAFHLLATYGGGILVAFATFGPVAPSRRTDRLA
ncbi:MAG: hypothetical protein M3Q66_10545 [Chloroflexota bacterium]|nr:hypothetical protein [Chloroflexota bacterium]